MRAGKLDRVISIERMTEALNENRTPVSAWSIIATIRAEVLQQSSDETDTGYGEAEGNDVTFRVRYLPGITTADRVTFDGRSFNLKGIVEIGRRRGLELRAVATS